MFLLFPWIQDKLRLFYTIWLKNKALTVLQQVFMSLFIKTQ